MHRTGEITPPCGVPLAAAFDRPVLQDPGAQHRAQEFEDVAVNDPFLDRRHQPLVRDRLKTVGDVRLGHPPPAPPGLVNDDLERVVSRAPGPKPERALEHVGLEDRLDDDLHRRLHDTVTDRGDRERTKLLAPGLRDEHPARGKRTPAPVLQIRGQLIEQPATPYSSTSAMVCLSMPAAPWLARTSSHARSRTSLR